MSDLSSIFVVFSKLYLSFDGENFANTERTLYGHGHQQIGNYRGKAFVTSCNWNGRGVEPPCNRKTELLDMESLKWSRGTAFPRSFAK